MSETTDVIQGTLDLLILKTLSLEPLGLGLGAALALPAAGTFILGIFPGLILTFAAKSAMFPR